MTLKTKSISFPEILWEEIDHKRQNLSRSKFLIDLLGKLEILEKKKRIETIYPIVFGICECGGDVTGDKESHQMVCTSCNQEFLICKHSPRRPSKPIRQIGGKRN